MGIIISLGLDLDDYKKSLNSLSDYFNNTVLKNFEKLRKEKEALIKELENTGGILEWLGFGGSAGGAAVSLFSPAFWGKFFGYPGMLLGGLSLKESYDKIDIAERNKQDLIIDDPIRKALNDVYNVWAERERLSLDDKKMLEDVVGQLKEIYSSRPMMDKESHHISDVLHDIGKEIRKDIWQAEIPEGYQEVLGQLYELQGATGGVLEVSESMFDNIKYEFEMISKLIGTGSEEFKKIEKILSTHGVEFREQLYNPITNESVMQYRFKSLEQVLAVIKDIRSEGEKLPGNLDIGNAPTKSFDFLTEGTKDFSAEIQGVQQKIIQLKDYIAESVDAAQDWANLDIKKPEIEFDFAIPENALEEHKKKLKKAFAEEMVGFVHTFDAQLKKVFGDDATTVINGFVDLFNKAGRDIEAMFTSHWDDVVALSLDALNRATGGSNQALQVVSGAFGQFQKLLEASGNSLTTMWENHWENVVDIGLNALAQLAGGANQALNSISATFSGALAGAKYGPWGALAGGALGFLSSLSSGPSNEELLASQGKKAAQIWGDAFTDEVAQVMASVAEKLPKAASGKVDVVSAMFHPDTIAALLKNVDELTAEIQSKLGTSIGHGVNMLMQKLGMTHKQAFEQFVPIFEDISRRIVESGGTLSKPLRDLMQHAKNLGVEFKGVLDIITDSIAGVKGELADLGRQFFDAAVGIDKMRWSLEGMRESLRETRGELRALAESGELRFRTILPSGEKVRRTGEGAYNAIMREIRTAQEEAKGGYIKRGAAKEIVGRARSEEAQLLIQQLIKQENEIALQKIQIEDAKKARGIMRTTREQLKNKLENLNNELAKQTAYLRAIAEGGGIGGGGRNRKRRHDENEGVDAQFGFDAIFRGPASGYTMPLTMHGQERLTITPANQMAAQQPIVINQDIKVIINADNSVGLNNYLDNGGDVEIANKIAKAVKMKNTALDPKIVRR